MKTKNDDIYTNITYTGENRNFSLFDVVTMKIRPFKVIFYDFKFFGLCKICSRHCVI